MIHIFFELVTSAQSTDKGVNKATEKLFKFISSPEDMLKLGEDGLIGYIKTIGLYRNKARNVIKLSQILVDQYNGIVPNSRAALESLPGVGRKTANVVLNMWWRHPAQALIHIFLELVTEVVSHLVKMLTQWSEQ